MDDAALSLPPSARPMKMLSARRSEFNWYRKALKANWRDMYGLVL